MPDRGVMPEHHVAAALAEVAAMVESGELDDPDRRARTVAYLYGKAQEMNEAGTARRKAEHDEAVARAKVLGRFVDIVERAVGQPVPELLEGVVLIEEAFGPLPRDGSET